MGSNLCASDPGLYYARSHFNPSTDYGKPQEAVLLDSEVAKCLLFCIRDWWKAFQSPWRSGRKGAVALKHVLCLTVLWRDFVSFRYKGGMIICFDAQCGSLFYNHNKLEIPKI